MSAELLCCLAELLRCTCVTSLHDECAHTMWEIGPCQHENDLTFTWNMLKNWFESLVRARAWKEQSCYRFFSPGGAFGRRLRLRRQKLCIRYRNSIRLPLPGLPGTPRDSPGLGRRRLFGQSCFSADQDKRLNNMRLKHLEDSGSVGSAFHMGTLVRQRRTKNFV